MKRSILPALSLVATLCVPAAAQVYPDKPVKLVLPYNPGGIVDFAGRTLAQQMSNILGQNVVSENRPGAGGMSGTASVAQSKGDGYTLLLIDPAVVINPSLQKSVPYDLKDLKVVSVVTSSPLLMVTAAKLEAKTAKDFIAYAKQSKGKLNFASAGTGTTPHLAGALFNMRTGADATHVPYRGSGPAVPDLMAGKVHFAFNTFVVAAPFLRDDKLRTLAVAGPRRIASAPDIPTMAEAGMPDFEVNLWLALFVPASTPQPIVDKLYAAVHQALQNAELKAALAKVGIEPEGLSPGDSDAYVKKEFTKWAEVIKTSGITAD